MTLKTDYSAHVEGMLASKRTRRRAWYMKKGAELPKWFVDAPDGLDIEQKCALFEKTVASFNRGFAVGLIGFAGALPLATIDLVKHQWTTAALFLLLAFGGCCMCIPLLKRKLVDRKLRRHSQL